MVEIVEEKKKMLRYEQDSDISHKQSDLKRLILVSAEGKKVERP